MSFKLLMIIFQIDSVYVGTSNILKTEEAQWQTSLKRSIQKVLGRRCVSKSDVKVCLHYDENAAFLRQASWFYEPEKFFISDKMGNTNAKTPRFCRSVNEP